ncbi:helix-turn-helix domain-containing protein [Agrococcus sp. ARC_14]|uniref:PucR family transcriptional regulator n=1 Tax=Agrococcus sp. ARC_14 TaxID=2919927 RepID=UPI001F068887|nr:helix-turn-helix domain-containing protein [Agrococcus sp. ARC_14]MCH1882980.1 helix-turn-helix domain-containing protein [Agrococcus sp. ARC_14]
MSEQEELKTQQLAWLRRISGDLSTQVTRALDDRLPWYGTMPPSRRSAVGLVAQSGITSFIAWHEDPEAQPWIAADVFAAAPRELLRSVSLQQTLQLIRTVVSVFEERIADADPMMREPILRYSREIAFAAADVYARAAESRGLWDARLEALVVDSILTGEHDDELPSRSAALGWHGRGECAVLVGLAPRTLDVDIVRRKARHAGCDVLVGVQGTRLVVVIGRTAQSDAAADEPIEFLAIAAQLSDGFGEGHLVLGPTVASIVEAAGSAKAALAGFAVADAWRRTPRPVRADDLLPERALAGDPLARSELVRGIYQPLRDHSSDLLATLACYLDTGRSLEATARELFVHPNTVRYRLKRISEIIGWDATGAREALALHTAIILGSIHDASRDRSQRQATRHAPRGKGPVGG